MKWLKKAVAVGMTCSLFISTTALTAIEAGAALKAEADPITVQQGPVRGVVRTNEGKRLVKAVIDVRDSKGEVIGVGMTKPDGTFCLATVDPGEYVLSVNGEYTYALNVTKDAEGQVISLVLPAQKPYSAGAAEEAFGPQALYVVGGMALTVTAAALLINSDDDCK